MRTGRLKANEAESLNNLAQIAAGTNLYANDHDQMMPTGYFYQPGQGEITYAMQLLPYVSNTTTLFIAPTSAIQPVKPSSGGFIAMTYSMNNLISPDTSTGGQPIRRTAILHPSEVILIADGAQSATTTYSRSTFTNPVIPSNGVPDTSVAIPVGPDADTTGGAGWLRYRDQGAVDVAMVDGHVEAMRKGSVCYCNIVPNQ
ncbi:MAG TPA: hypothetical protein VHY22_01320 [Chthoniobacteraceae bacterium]|nr:hypothetical protein [Chthoniobacteraceae bacterium]